MVNTAIAEPTSSAAHGGPGAPCEYPAVAASVRDARNCVVDFALAHGATLRASEDIRLAVSEAASNVVRHAYRDERTGSFRISTVADDERMDVTIEDDGCGLSTPAVDPGFGAGVMLMSTVARQARFREGADGGSTVELSFDLL